MKVLTRLIEGGVATTVVDVSRTSGTIIRLCSKKDTPWIDVSNHTKVSHVKNKVVFIDSDYQSLVDKIGFDNVCKLVVI
jgi:hypothetical protein